MRTVTLALATFFIDIVTKRWALQGLVPGETLHMLHGVVPLTLAFNTGIAFGIQLGGIGGGALLVMSAGVLVGLGWLYIRARPGDPYRLAGIALVAGGAAGNLVDRVRWTRGVVDFIGPIDLGVFLFPIFNVADVSITLGALLVAASLGWEERFEEEEAGATVTS